MKYLILTGLIILVTVSLAFKKRVNNQDVNALFGTWKSVETYAKGAVGKGKWIKVPDSLSKILQIGKNGIIDGSYLGQATYKLTDSLGIDINFPDKHMEKYRYRITDQRLILIPPCDEGCAIVFINVKQ
jgi:hypothetical protein